MMTKPEFLALALILCQQNGVTPSGTMLDTAWSQYQRTAGPGTIDSSGYLLSTVALALDTAARMTGYYLHGGQVRSHVS